ncbi:MAG: hypothetical protein K6T35_02085, partial [Meiothermus silvanus]|nr:hypothetical protein [Allomeiothermus silvanus]
MKGIRWKFGSISAVLLAGTLSLSRVLAQDYDPSATLNLATNADPTLNPWTPGAVVESNLINT